jgi:hypothetical protein
MLKEQAQVQRLAVPQDATRLSGRLQAVVMAHQATKCFAQSNLPLRALEQAIPVSHDSAQDQGPYPQIVLALPVRHSVVGSDAPQVIKVLAPRLPSVCTKHLARRRQTLSVHKYPRDSDDLPSR